MSVSTSVSIVSLSLSLSLSLSRFYLCLYLRALSNVSVYICPRAHPRMQTHAHTHTHARVQIVLLHVHRCKRMAKHIEPHAVCARTGVRMRVYSKCILISLNSDRGLFSHNCTYPHSIVISMCVPPYGVATISRLLQIIGLFCRI